MVGDRKTGRVEGVVLTAVVHEGLTVLVNGKPGRLAVLDEHGKVVACGDDVAREAASVAVNNYRNFLKAQGHLRVFGSALETAASDDELPCDAMRADDEAAQQGAQ